MTEGLQGTPWQPYTIELQVHAEHQADARDLADDVAEAVRAAQKRGQHQACLLVGYTLGSVHAPSEGRTEG